MTHVPDAVDEDQQADETHHHQHDRSQGIEDPTELKHLSLQPLAKLKPFEVEDLAISAARVSKRLGESNTRENKAPDHRANRERSRKLAIRLLRQGDQPGCRQRQRGNQPEILDNAGHSSGDPIARMANRNRLKPGLHTAWSPAFRRSVRLLMLGSI